MKKIPKYTPEENLRRVRMEKRIKFLVVEGVDDIPIYESAIKSAGHSEKFRKWDIVHSEGKPNLINLIEGYKGNNFLCVADKDFSDIKVSDHRLIILDRYSIENYFICEEAISAAIAIAIKCKYSDAKDAFSLENFYEEVERACKKLLMAIFYYQKEMVPKLVGIKKIAWSETFLCKENTWKLCKNRINGLIDLLNPGNVGWGVIENFYNKNFLPGKHITSDFPGKMLTSSLQRYVRNSVISVKPSAKGKFNTPELFSDSISAVLHRSKNFMGCLSSVFYFLFGSPFTTI